VRADLDDLRVLLAACRGQIPLGLQLVFMRRPSCLHRARAESAAQLTDPFVRGAQAPFQIFMHAAVLTSPIARRTT
jgi:hypothetical protein